MTIYYKSCSFCRDLIHKTMRFPLLWLRYDHSHDVHHSCFMFANLTKGQRCWSLLLCARVIVCDCKIWWCYPAKKTILFYPIKLCICCAAPSLLSLSRSYPLSSSISISMLSLLHAINVIDWDHINDTKPCTGSPQSIIPLMTDCLFFHHPNSDDM